ncbi:UDP-N-acetylglucosamine pyrophosphorylase [Puccinia sorghi]|uniref:UDP-N-acetylglucosamine diphosphorylase n=1 Tax=Puccinia sorghi TaxID=27349 RepID=A0A0L6VVD6_9BASI|nr:UDP-N-acetylglucosamine pyrophosphorylase [Puccinia sorghi]
MDNSTKIRQQYEEAGQGHVFTFFDGLNPQEKEELINQLKLIDPQRVNQIFKKSTSKTDDSGENIDLEPPPKQSLESIIDITNDDIKQNVSQWQSLGLKSIKEQKVAILLLAGGQGTRLGSSDPKGCYNIGLPSQKSLFHLQAEKIIRLQDLFQYSVKLTPKFRYIMTSAPTRKPTEEYFIKMNYFGLKKENVIFFEQGMYTYCVLPALTPDGKMFLETPSKVCVAPDGNGGLYAALRSSATCSAGRSVLEDLKARGVEYIHGYCVDNCLVKVADPIFLGYCIGKKTRCGVKVVLKSEPQESVGVVALKNKRWAVVEYSEMAESVASSRSENGELKFKSANIANHFYSLEFLESIESFESELAYHIAHKKIPHMDLKSKQLIKPSQPNGIKLELFIFDVFPFVDSLSLLEVDRAEEFSPLKNAPNTGTDDPQTSRRDLLAQQKRWLQAAGCRFESSDIEVELSALVSYAGEGLETLNGKTIRKSVYIKSTDELEKI